MEVEGLKHALSLIMLTNNHYLDDSFNKLHKRFHKVHLVKRSVMNKLASISRDIGALTS